MFRRWRGYLARRGSFQWVPPAPPAVAPSRPPEYIDARGWRPRWPSAALRRGRFQPVPLTQAGPAPQGIQSDSVRWRTLRGRRGAFYAVGPAPVVAGPAPAVPQFLQPDSVRWRTLRTRRGRVQPVVPAPVVVTAPPVVPLVERAVPRRLALTRRGRLFVVPPPQVAAAPPVLPPAYVQQETRRFAPRVRRGRYFEPSWPAYGIGMAVGVGGSDSRQLVTVLPPRRGRLWTVPPVGTLAGPGPLLPVVRRPALRRGFLPRRGEFFPPPTPVGVLPGAGPVPPRMVRQSGPRPRFGWRNRDHLFEPPWPVVAPSVPPVPPALLGGRPPLAPRVVRRARIEPPWTAQQPAGPVPAGLARRTRPGLPTRRGRFHTVIRGGLTVGPGPVPPRMASTRRRYEFRARRGRFLEPVWPFVPPPPFFVGSLTATTGPTSTLIATGSTPAVLAAGTAKGGPG